MSSVSLTSVKARDLIGKDPAALLATIPTYFKLVFDDGETLDTNVKETVFSVYFWAIHAHYPKLQLLKRHHVAHFLKGEFLKSSTHIDMFTTLNRDVIHTYDLWEPKQKEPLLRLIYEITNRIYNEVTKFAERDVISIDILDFIQVAETPALKEAFVTARPTHESVEKITRIAFDTIDNDMALAGNGLVQASRTRTINQGQLTQCIAVRGEATEVDGAHLTQPIMSNYLLGMDDKLYHLMAESRSAAKALFHSESPLQDSEYFARRLQLLTMAVERVVYGKYRDCGTKRHIAWRVKGPTFSSKGRMTYAGDLKFMTGKYYLASGSTEYAVIDGSENHLVGQTIQLRSVLHCQHPNKHEICERCFGQLSQNISAYANVGHNCSAVMTQQTTQSVLSTKHLDPSGRAAEIVLTASQNVFFTTDTAKSSYVLKKEYAKKHLRMLVAQEEAEDLAQIFEVADVADVNPIRVAKISAVTIQMRQGANWVSSEISVVQQNHNPTFSKAFLVYIRNNRWTIDEHHNYVFDLQNWNYSEPLLKVPDMDYSYSDHSKMIAALIESSLDRIQERNNPDSPVSTLVELFELVNSKLNVNIACLEVIIYALMVPNPYSFDLSRGHANPVLGNARKLIRNRTASTCAAFDQQPGVIFSPQSFFGEGRVASPMDALLMPQEVIAAEEPDAIR